MHHDSPGCPAEARPQRTSADHPLSELTAPWLPCRGEALVIGGDLAYPSPTNETYETRFFRPYEAAMPAPAHAVPGALVLQKPDLPLDGCSSCRGPPPRAVPCTRSTASGTWLQAPAGEFWVRV